MTLPAPEVWGFGALLSSARRKKETREMEPNGNAKPGCFPKWVGFDTFPHQFTIVTGVQSSQAPSHRSHGSSHMGPIILGLAVYSGPSFSNFLITIF